MTIEELRKQKADALDQAQRLYDTAKNEDRDLTEEESDQVDQYLEQSEQTDAQIKKVEADEQRRNRLKSAQADLSKPVRRTTPDNTQDPFPPDSRVEVGELRAAEDRDRNGFNHFGEFAHAVKKFVVEHAVDERLQIGAATPSNYGTGQVGADGGFAIPDEFRAELLSHAFSEAALLPRTFQIPTDGNTLEIPKDETTPWGSDGVQVNWTGEGAQINTSKPGLGSVDIKLHSLKALVPLTNELLEDSAIPLEAYLRQVVPPKIQWKIDNAIMNGSGAGQPRGILNSDALHSVAKESGQSADTVVAGNVAKMLAAQPAESQLRATYVHHSSVLPQLITMTVSNQPIFTAPGQLNRAPFGSLLGRPLIPQEACQTLGDKGDIYLIDFQKYVTVVKTGQRGTRRDVSIHLYFDRDMTAFRFVFRIGGQPWLSSPIDQANGSGKLSPFVTLDERA